MGHPTYAEILDMLVEVRDAEYRSDPERQEARLKSIDSILQMMLEKMRDNFDPSVC